MTQSRTFIAVVILLVMLALQVTAPVYAGSEPLPALPPQWLTDKVINETGGPTFYIVGSPTSMQPPLAAFSGALDNIEYNLDYDQSVSYVATTEYLYETLIPMDNSRYMTLAPDMTAPGSPSAPGKIIGATYERGRGVMVVVTTFPGWSSTTPNGLRFYYNSTEYYSVVPRVGRFLDPNGDQVVEALDEGAVISDLWSCLGVGLKQVCWAPYSTSQLRDADAVRSLLNSAYNQAVGRYQLTVTFDMYDGVPDLIGQNRREWCASDFSWKTLTEQMQGCQPNLAFVHSNTVAAGQPIGLWVVRNWAQLKVYDMTGGYWGWLPPNSYLVMDATPSRTQFGQIGVLMLVAINGNDHFLIPSNIMQGFAQSSVIDEWDAAIKDGTMRSRGF